MYKMLIWLNRAVEWDLKNHNIYIEWPKYQVSLCNAKPFVSEEFFIFHSIHGLRALLAIGSFTLALYMTYLNPRSSKFGERIQHKFPLNPHCCLKFLLDRHGATRKTQSNSAEFFMQSLCLRLLNLWMDCTFVICGDGHLNVHEPTDQRL